KEENQMIKLAYFLAAATAAMAADPQVNFVTPHEGDKSVTGSYDNIACATGKTLSARVDVLNGDRLAYTSPDVTVDTSKRTFAASVPALAESQGIHLHVYCDTDEQAEARDTVASAGYDWGRVKAYFTVGTLIARDQGKFSDPEPYSSFNVDY